MRSSRIYVISIIYFIWKKNLLIGYIWNWFLMWTSVWTTKEKKMVHRSILRTKRIFKGTCTSSREPFGQNKRMNNDRHTSTAPHAKLSVYTQTVHRRSDGAPHNGPSAHHHRTGPDDTTVTLVQTLHSVGCSAVTGYQPSGKQ